MIDEFSDLMPYHCWIYAALFVIAIISYKKYGKKCSLFKSKTEKALALAFGILFSGCYAIGLVLSTGGSLAGKSRGFILLSCVLFSGGVGLAYHYCNGLLERAFESSTTASLIKRPFLISFLVIFLAWIPVFLALYPGLFAYDVVNQLDQTVGSFNVHHPLLHTFYLQLFYKLGCSIGSPNTGMAISVLIQMILFALSLAYTLSYLHSRKVKDAVFIFILLFFSLVPIFPIMAVSMTKDIPFAAFFNVLFVLLLRYTDQASHLNRKSFAFSIVLFSFLTAMLRNNGKLAVFAALAALLLSSLIHKKDLKKIFALCAASVVLIVSFSNFLVYATDAIPVSKNEAMSIPYQQLARVYKYNRADFSEDDLAVVEQLIPAISTYNPFLSDSVKGGATVFDHSGYVSYFCRVYWKYLMRNPTLYIEAFMLNTMGYWYLDDVSSSQMYGKLSDGQIADDYGLFLMDTKEGFGVYHQSKFPALDQWIKQMFHLNHYQDYPVFSTIFSMALYFWMVLGALFYAIQTKRKGLVVPLVLFGAYTASIVAGPCALFRYALPCLVCIPALLSKIYKKS